VGSWRYDVQWCRRGNTVLLHLLTLLVLLLLLLL
jgi:hypothetical protein